MAHRLLPATLWTAAVLLTLALAVFQRLSGPTYPLREQLTLNDTTISLTLRRTHPGDGGLQIVVPEAPPGLNGAVRWRRYPTQEDWLTVPLVRAGTTLRAELPHQPPAGKIEYAVKLELAGTEAMVPSAKPVIARYRGEVSARVLIPHILTIFLAMLLATRAMLDRLAIASDRRLKILLTMVMLLLGGALLGPLVQLQAFGAYWTGWPLGNDLTDNKMAVAIAAWLPATVLALRRRQTRWSVIAGWIVMMVVFLIPHSLRGSQHDWSEQSPAGQATVSSPQSGSPQP